MILGGAIVCLLPQRGAGQSDFQGAMHPVQIYEEPISYDETENTGPVTDLIRKIEKFLHFYQCLCLLGSQW